MNLGEMLIRLGDIVNKSPNAPDEREYMVRQLNVAYEFLWMQNDLPMSLRSITIRAPSSRTVCLPEYIGKIRGARRCSCKITVFDEAARFADALPPGCFSPVVMYKSAVSDNSVDFTSLRWELDQAATCAITMKLYGATTSSSNQEIITRFGKGETVKAIPTNLVSIKSTYKDVLTGPNVRLMCNVSDEIANIPSGSHTSNYIVYQLIDPQGYWCGCLDDGLICGFELYYKPTLIPLSSDSDTLQADDSEMPVVYYAAAQIKANSPSNEIQKQAAGFATQALTMTQAADRNDMEGKEHSVGHMRRGFPRLRRVGASRAWWNPYS